MTLVSFTYPTNLPLPPDGSEGQSNSLYNVPLNFHSLYISLEIWIILL